MNADGTLKSSNTFLFSSPFSSNWYCYSTAGIVSQTDVIGVLLYISSARDMMGNLYNLRSQMILMFAITAAIALLGCLIMSGIVTRPIFSLTRGIQNMARGDFSTRVTPYGSGELRRLANTFNSMSEKL